MKYKNTEKNMACIIGFNDTKTIIIGIPLIGIILPMMFFNSNPFVDWSDYWKLALVSMLNAAVFWTIHKWLLLGLRIFIPDIKDYGKKLVLQIVGFSLVTVFISYLSCNLQSFIDSGVENGPSVREIYLASFTISAFILLLYEAMYFFDLWKIGIIENEQLQTENTKAQLSLLKNQVNPHFLFNSLNTLASVIPEDPELAVVFVEKLSAVYRYVLEIKNKELISLQEELRCIESFEFLLKIRFGDKLLVNKSIDTKYLNYYIVPMSLQMLIENAVKHNVVSSKDPLIIEMFIENEKIVVQNKIKLKAQIQDSTQTGLENIKQRYKIIANQKMKYSSKNGIFRVSLPLLDIEEYRT